MNAKSTKKASKSKTDWTKLHLNDDSNIDYSDISATTEEFWADADVFIPQHKVHVSIRLDDEIVNFFKQGGRGYQSKINAVLKAYVYAHTKTHRNKHAH